MKIPQELALELIKYLREVGERDASEINGKILDTYSLEDITLSFERGDKPRFFGIIFQLFGTSFTILSNLELWLSVEGDSIEDAVELTDKAFVATIIEYLEWRLKVIREFEL